jgi:hypothetical protein
MTSPSPLDDDAALEDDGPMTREVEIKATDATPLLSMSRRVMPAVAAAEEADEEADLWLTALNAVQDAARNRREATTFIVFFEF